MKNILLLILILTFLFSCNIQKNKTIIDDRTNNEILIGQCNRKAFDKDAFKKWFTDEYENYNTDDVIINKLKKFTKLNDTEILIIFSTWCHDSRRELPRFYKIADEVGYSKFNLRLVAVDTKKSSRNKSLEGIEFTRIPTFIFYNNGIEIGRIVESVKVSLESDILEIISKIE